MIHLLFPRKKSIWKRILAKDFLAMSPKKQTMVIQMFVYLIKIKYFVDLQVSEERNPEDFINTELTSIKLEGDHDRPEETISIISSAFNNR